MQATKLILKTEYYKNKKRRKDCSCLLGKGCDIIIHKSFSSKKDKLYGNLLGFGLIYEKDMMMRMMLSLVDVLREPFESLAIAHFTDDAAHEDLERANTRVSKCHFSLTGGKVGETQVIPKLVF